MSLINDALRRASQSERDRPPHAASPVGMQPTPAARHSHLTLVLGMAVLVALLLAGWFFWRWWNARNVPAETRLPAPITVAAIPAPVPLPKPVPVAPEVVKPVPVPVVVPATPVVAPPSNVANASPVTWPLDLKLNAIFFSKANPHALINGTVYQTGDQIQGVVVKSIEKDQVTVDWNGHSKILMMEGH